MSTSAPSALTIAQWFPQHKLPELAHPPAHRNPLAPSRSTRLAALYHPEQPCVVARFRYVDQDNPSNPITALASILVSSGLNIDAPLPGLVPGSLEMTAYMARTQHVRVENDMYSLLVTGCGLAASVIDKDQDKGDANWHSTPDNFTSTADLFARTDDATVVAQAEVKMDAKVNSEMLEAVRASAADDGFLLEYVETTDDSPRFFRSTIRDVERQQQAILDNALAQGYWNMQQKNLAFTIVATWSWLIVLHQPSPLGDVYVSDVIKRDFPAPTGTGAIDFVQTPLGVYTATLLVPQRPEAFHVTRLTGLATSTSSCHATRTRSSLRRRRDLNAPPPDSIPGPPSAATRSKTTAVANSTSVVRDSLVPPHTLGALAVLIHYTEATEATKEEATHSLHHINRLERAFFGPLDEHKHEQSAKPATDQRQPRLLPKLGHQDSNVPRGLDNMIISLGGHVGSGRTWDCYRGCIVESMPSSRALGNIMVKIICPISFTPRYTRNMYSSGVPYTEEEVRRAVMQENRVYDSLRELQGIIIPRCYGIFGSQQRGWDNVETWVMLLEDAGSYLEEGQVTRTHCLTILSHYETLQSHGVVHNDVSRKHWLYNKTTGRICIIDFEGSFTYDDVVARHDAESGKDEDEDDEEDGDGDEGEIKARWEGAVKYEMEQVREELESLLGSKLDQDE